MPSEGKPRFVGLHKRLWPLCALAPLMPNVARPATLARFVLGFVLALGRSSLSLVASLSLVTRASRPGLALTLFRSTAAWRRTIAPRLDWRPLAVVEGISIRRPRDADRISVLRVADRSAEACSASPRRICCWKHESDIRARAATRSTDIGSVFHEHGESGSASLSLRPCRAAPRGWRGSLPCGSG